MSLDGGTRLGPYEILAPIGAGGMGEVYRGRDVRLSRLVAIKVLPERLAADPEALARFEAEARAVAALSHPHILAIHDIGREGDTRFAVMELLEGETLSDRLARGALPWRKTAEIGVALAEGLSAAHARGIVHRDLKPQNIFLTASGGVKILDFGLARRDDRQGTPSGGDETPTTPVLTEPGLLVGTVGYMSPEQIRARPADARSDIFALGCVLYEMATNRRPFERESAAETMAAILREEPADVSSSERQVPPDLARVISHCLEKNPEERFQSARDLAFSLRATLSGAGVSEAIRAPRISGRGRWPRRLVFAAGGAAAAAVLVLLGRATVPHSSGAAATFRQLTFRRGTVWSARLSPDGQTVAYAAAWDGDPSALFVTRLDNPESRPLGISGQVLSISGAGEMLILERPAYIAQMEFRGTLARVPVLGGTPRPIADDARWAAWSPDGSGAAVVVDRGGGDRLEYPPGRVLYQTEGWISRPVFVGGGSAIAFLDHPLRWDDRGKVCLVGLDGKRRDLTGEWESEEGLAWNAQTRELWFSAATAGVSRAVYAVSLSGARRLVGRIADGLTVQDVSPGVGLLATRENMRSGVLAWRNGQAEEKDLSWFGDSAAGDLSDDGRMLLFHDYSAEAGPRYAVGMRSLDGSPPFRIGDGRAMALSPDGRLALASLPTSPSETLELLPTGAGHPVPLATGPVAFFQWACWFPGGREILYAGKPLQGELRVYRQKLDGSGPVPLTPDGFGLRSSHAVSPDSSRATLLDPLGRIALLTFATGRIAPLPGAQPGELPARWSRDGRSVIVYRSHAAFAQVTRIDAASGKRTDLREIRPADPAGLISVAGIRLTPGGTAYAYTYERRLSDLFLVRGWR